MLGGGYARSCCILRFRDRRHVPYGSAVCGIFRPILRQAAEPLDSEVVFRYWWKYAGHNGYSAMVLLSPATFVSVKGQNAVFQAGQR